MSSWSELSLKMATASCKKHQEMQLVSWEVIYHAKMQDFLLLLRQKGRRITGQRPDSTAETTAAVQVRSVQCLISDAGSIEDNSRFKRCLKEKLARLGEQVPFHSGFNG